MRDLTAGMARRMRCAMAVRGISGAELAATLEVSRPTVTRWTQGRQNLSAEWAARVAAALRVPVGWLIGGEPLDTGCGHLIERLRGEMPMLLPDQRDMVLLTVMLEVGVLAGVKITS